MTVASAVSRKTFTGDDATTAFATTPVVFFDETDLLVYLITTATGAAELQSLTTDYTVTGGAGSTGTVTMLTAPASTQTLLIKRVVPITQATDFVNNDASDAETAEDALDKLTMIAQQLASGAVSGGYGLRLPELETPTDALTVLPFDRASTVLGFDASKNLTTYDASSAVTEASNVTFLQSGSGAISRNLQDRGREWVMATDYPTLVAAYASLSSTGGTVVVPSNYSETLTASITLSKPYSGFLFMGPATITMGSNQVIVSPGVDGVFIEAWGGTHGSEHTGATSAGVIFRYTGSSNAIVIGDNSDDTEHVSFKNVTINTDSAGTSAVGLYATRMTFSELHNICIGQSGAGGASQKGIVLDGDGNYSGYVSIQNPVISGGNIGIQTLNQVNHVNVIGGTLNSSAASGTPIGIDRQGNGSGFIAIGLEVGAWVTGVKLGASTHSDFYIIRVEQNTTDFEAVSGSSNHRCATVGTTDAVTVSDAGTRNVFYKNADMGSATLLLNGAGKAYVTTDAAEAIAQRNGTNAQVFRLYNTFTNSSNYERVVFNWSGNAFRLLVENLGSGSARSFRIGTSGSNVFRVVTAGTDQWDFDTSGNLVDLAGNSIKTGAPVGGTAAAFKVGVAAVVSPTSPNRTIELDIAGTTYYLHAKTTND